MTTPNILVRPQRKAVLAALALAMLPGMVMAADAYDTERAVREIERLREQEQAERERSDRLRVQQQALDSQQDAIRRMEERRQHLAESSREATGVSNRTGPEYVYSYPGGGGRDNGLASPQLPAIHPLTNMEFATISASLGRYFGVESGVLVVRSGAGASWGLQDGDVVLAVDGRAATSEQQLHRVLRSYQSGEQFRLSIQRNRKAMELSAAAP